MIDDVWELIDFLPNGDLQINPISPAWVCSNWCGYYVEIEKEI